MTGKKYCRFCGTEMEATAAGGTAHAEKPDGTRAIVYTCPFCGETAEEPGKAEQAPETAGKSRPEGDGAGAPVGTEDSGTGSREGKAGRKNSDDDFRRTAEPRRRGKATDGPGIWDRFAALFSRKAVKQEPPAKDGEGRNTIRIAGTSEKEAPAPEIREAFDYIFELVLWTAKKTGTTAAEVLDRFETDLADRDEILKEERKRAEAEKDKGTEPLRRAADRKSEFRPKGEKDAAGGGRPPGRPGMFVKDGDGNAKLSDEWIDWMLRNNKYFTGLYDRIVSKEQREERYLAKHEPSLRVIIDDVLYDTDPARSQMFLKEERRFSVGRGCIRYYQTNAGMYFKIISVMGRDDEFAILEEKDVKRLLGSRPEIYVEVLGTDELIGYEDYTDEDLYAEDDEDAGDGGGRLFADVSA